jgi:tetratricopeptide (TPR) repeat protein
MPRFMKRNRPIVLVLISAGALLIGGAAILWGKTRRLPDPASEATAAYVRRDWARAGSLAQKRLKETPDDPQVLRLAARAAARQDQDQKAIAIYNRFVVGAMDPEDFFLMGRAWNRAGQAEPAMKAFEMALKGDPEHSETLDALGQLYLQNDRYGAVEEIAGRLARQRGREAHGFLMLGTARAELADPAGAAEALRRWRQFDPEGRSAAPHPVAAFRKLLARSLLKSRQPSEARAVLEALLEAGPDPEATWLLSRSFIQERRWDRASAALGQASSYRAENPLEFEPAPYIGEARCGACHREEYQAVLASRHATTFARARELGNLPLPKDPLPDPGDRRVLHHFERVGDSFRVETRTGSQTLRAIVDYAFGSRDHYTTFVGRDDQHREVMLRISHYDSPRGKGWDISTGLPPHPADEEEFLGKPMLTGDGVRRCLYCHTTNLRAVLTETGPESADHSIGCERCHGPGGHHDPAAEAGFSDLTIGSPGQASAAAIDEMCGKCHSMHRPGTISAPQTDPVWLRFQALGLTWSRCYTESQGNLSCVTCHDPHRNADTLAPRNEAKCLACHHGPGTGRAGSSIPSTGPEGDGPAPVRQKQVVPDAKTSCPINPIKGCIECHMPRQWQEGTHSFKTDHFIRVHEGAPSAR